MPLLTNQRLCVLGHALVVLTLALSLMQNLVLNPLATVPGHSLGQIQAEVAGAGQSLDVGLVIAIAVAYSGLATALLVRTRSTVLSAVLLAGVMPLHWFSSFVARDRTGRHLRDLRRTADAMGLARHGPCAGGWRSAVGAGQRAPRPTICTSAASARIVCQRAHR